MVSRIVVASLALILTTAVTDAGFADVKQVGDFEITEFGATEAEAGTAAYDELDEFLDEFEEKLPGGKVVIGVGTTDEWDGQAYTITFTIYVWEDD